jgi:signal transduction histidine kinase
MPTEAEQRRAALTLRIARLVLALVVVAFVVSIAAPSRDLPLLALIYLPTLGAVLACVFVLQRGRVRAAAWALTLTTYVLVCVAVFWFGGLKANNAVAFTVVVMIAGTTMNARAALSMAALSSATCMLAWWAEALSLLPQPAAPLTAFNAWLAVTVTLLAAASLHDLAIRSLDDAHARTREALEELRASRDDNAVLARRDAAVAELSRHALRAPAPLGFFPEAARTISATLEGARVYLVGRREEHGGWVLSAEAPEPTIVPELGSAFETDDPDLTLPPESLAALSRQLDLSGVARARVLAVRGRAEVHALLVVLFPPTTRPPPASDTFLRTVADVLASLFDRAAADEKAQRAQKMEVVGRLASGVAHDFNNLLAGMVGIADELHARHGGQPADVALIRELSSAAHQAALLTKQLLAFSRRRAGERVPVDVGSVVRAFVPMMRRLLPADITIQLDVPPTPYVVLGDRAQVEQIVLNLVVNARDAIGTGGHVTVRIADGATPETLSLSVADDGCGMDAATQRRALQPFFTTKQEGTGLGLATVADIVERMGGLIHLDSEIGRGTTVHVTLPRERGPAVAAPISSEHATITRGSAHILLAEDDPLVSRSTVRVLTRAGFVVRAVGSGREALAALDEPYTCELVISDVSMPDMTGPQLLDALAERGSHVPVILTSGNASPDGFDRYPFRVLFLAKPFAASALSAMIDELTRGEAPAPS